MQYYNGTVDLSKQLIVKVDGRTFKIPFVVKKIDKKLDIFVGSGYASADTRSVIHFEFTYTPALVSAIGNSNFVGYRFYLNNKPVTIEMKGSDLQGMKDFLTLQKQ